MRHWLGLLGVAAAVLLPATALATGPTQRPPQPQSVAKQTDTRSEPAKAKPEPTDTRTARGEPAPAKRKDKANPAADGHGKPTGSNSEAASPAPGTVAAPPPRSPALAPTAASPALTVAAAAPAPHHEASSGVAAAPRTEDQTPSVVDDPQVPQAQLYATTPEVELAADTAEADLADASQLAEEASTPAAGVMQQDDQPVLADAASLSAAPDAAQSADQADAVMLAGVASDTEPVELAQTCGASDCPMADDMESAPAAQLLAHEGTDLAENQASVANPVAAATVEADAAPATIAAPPAEADAAPATIAAPGAEADAAPATIAAPGAEADAAPAAIAAPAAESRAAPATMAAPGAEAGAAPAAIAAPAAEGRAAPGVVAAPILSAPGVLSLSVREPVSTAPRSATEPAAALVATLGLLMTGWVVHRSTRISADVLTLGRPRAAAAGALTLLGGLLAIGLWLRVVSGAPALASSPPLGSSNQASADVPTQAFDPALRSPVEVSASADPNAAEVGKVVTVQLRLTNHGTTQLWGADIATDGPWDAYDALSSGSNAVLVQTPTGWSLQTRLTIPVGESRDVRVALVPRQAGEQHFSFVATGRDFLGRPVGPPSVNPTAPGA